MPSITEHVDIERKPQKPQKPKLGGGGPGKIPHRRGYGGGDDGDRGDHDRFRPGKDQLWRARVGMLAALASVTVVFVVLTILYLVRTGMGRLDHGVYVYDWKPLTLPYRQLFISTFVLLLSSITLELARRGLRRRIEYTSLGIRPPKLHTDLPWLLATMLLGLGFIASQVLVWNLLRSQGIYQAFSPSRNFFYLLTGTHAAHLLGGVIALFGALAGILWLRMKPASQRIMVDLVGWYWHFMGVLWICIFALLHFVKGSGS